MGGGFVLDLSKAQLGRADLYCRPMARCFNSYILTRSSPGFEDCERVASRTPAAVIDALDAVVVTVDLEELSELALLAIMVFERDSTAEEGPDATRVSREGGRPALAEGDVDKLVAELSLDADVLCCEMELGVDDWLLLLGAWLRMKVVSFSFFVSFQDEAICECGDVTRG